MVPTAAAFGEIDKKVRVLLYKQWLDQILKNELVLEQSFRNIGNRQNLVRTLRGITKALF